MTIKLMSWNVDERVNDLPQQLARIDNAQVDILALQEVALGTIQRIRNHLAQVGIKHVKTSHQRSGPHQYGVLIASRWPFVLMPRFFKSIPWQKSALSVVVKSDYEEIELHTLHVPPASSNNRKIKVETFDGIYKALAKPSNRHRILCGDFNSPKEESSDGTAYWGPKYGQRSEKQVLKGLKEHDLEDTYRKLHPDYNDGEYSHVNRNPKTPNRRYDHILSSTSLNPKKCGYLHHCLKDDLSDHAPVYALYEPKILRLPIKPSGQ